MNFAVIEDNKIVNLIVADSLETAEEVTGKQCIDCTNGWDYDNGIDYGDFFYISEGTPTVEWPMYSEQA